MTARTHLLGPLLALAMGGTLVACGDDTGSSDAAGGDLKAVLVTNQPSGDKGSIDLMIAGLEDGAEKLGWSAAENVYVSDVGQFETTLRKYADADFDLIFTAFPPLTQATITVAEEYPDVKFVNLGGEFVDEADIPENMGLYSALEAQGSFLAGALAAKMTETGKVGFLAGPTVDINLRWMSGAIQGAVYVNPDIEWVDAETKSYADPANGKDVALRLFESGVDVIMTAAAGTDLGIHEAAESNPDDWHTITLDSRDIKSVAPNAGLAAITVRYDNWVYEAMERVTEGSFKGGYTYISLAEGGWSIEQWGDGVPADVRAEIEALHDKIVEGEVDVVATWPEDKEKLNELRAQVGS